jgi:hypothetical protein
VTLVVGLRTCHFGRWAACGHDGHDGDLAVDLVSAGVHWRADRLEWGQGALGDAASRRALNWRCNAPQFFSEPYPYPPCFAQKSPQEVENKGLEVRKVFAGNCANEARVWTVLKKGHLSTVEMANLRRFSN